MGEASFWELVELSPRQGSSALVWGRVVAACAPWGLKSSSFGFRHGRQPTLGSSLLRGFCCFLLTSWDRSLTT